MRSMHGDRKNRAPLYRTWSSMRERCSNPKRKDYHRYGGRGVSVCAEWDDYLAFKAWALANGYEQHLTIDRVENDGGYEPGNCRWVTRAVQVRHQQRPVMRGDGVVYSSLAEAAKAVGTGPANIHAALSGRTKTAFGHTWQYLRRV
jgi:hypothetical protein